MISFIHVAFRTHHCLLQKGDFFEFNSFKPNKTTHKRCQAFIPVSRLPHTCNFIHATMLKSKYFWRISAHLQGESRSQNKNRSYKSHLYARFYLDFINVLNFTVTSCEASDTGSLFQKETSADSYRQNITFAKMYHSLNISAGFRLLQQE